MNLGLRDRAAIVTGASRGIGRQVALALAAEGARVLLCARDANALGEVVTKFAGRGVDVGSLRTALIAKFEVEITRQIGQAVITLDNYTGGLQGLNEMRGAVEAIAPLTDVNGTLFSTAGAAARMEKLREIDEAIQRRAVVEDPNANG